MRHAHWWMLLAVVPAMGFAQDNPVGWKQPAPVEDGCAEMTGRYEVSADFDGNGQADTARVLTRDDGRALGLWMWRNGAPPVLILTLGGRDGHHQWGIALVSPGRDTTFEGNQVTWKHPSLDLFSCEASNQLVYWSDRAGRFRRAWMTD